MTLRSCGCLRAPRGRRVAALEGGGARCLSSVSLTSASCGGRGLRSVVFPHVRSAREWRLPAVCRLCVLMGWGPSPACTFYPCMDVYHYFCCGMCVSNAPTTAAGGAGGCARRPSVFKLRASQHPVGHLPQPRGLPLRTVRPSSDCSTLGNELGLRAGPGHQQGVMRLRGPGGVRFPCTVALRPGPRAQRETGMKATPSGSTSHTHSCGGMGCPS